MHNLPFFPYPRDRATRIGFMLGDLLALALLLLMFIPVANNFLR